MTIPSSVASHPRASAGELFLGVDAGGTKTVALLSDSTGRIVGSGRAGPCNIYDAVPKALEALDSAVSEALRGAGSSLERVAAVCLSATGADWPEDFALLETNLEARKYRRVRVVNDAMGALRAGSPDGTGVVVVCGTSAGIGAKSSLGATWHSSFWQEPEGAEQLGRAALRAVYRSELGLDPPTSMTAPMLAHHRLNSVEALLHAHTSRDHRAGQRVGQLARILLDEAARGDITARRIAHAHGELMGDYAIIAARKVGLLDSGFALVTAGGVMRHPSHLIADALLARVLAVAPKAELIRSPLEPVAGAVFLALEAADVAVTATLRANLSASLPSPALFHT